MVDNHNLAFVGSAPVERAVGTSISSISGAPQRNSSVLNRIVTGLLTYQNRGATILNKAIRME